MRNSNHLRYITIAGLIVVLFVSPTMNGSFAQNIQDAPQLYEKAHEHFMVGEHQEAIDLYDQILEISPTNSKTTLMK